MTIKINNQPIRIAITGLTYSGKSSTIDLLNKKGYQTTPEAARIVIERELAKNSDCLPWKNIQKFQDETSNLQYSLENEFQEGIIFSDRSLVDGHAHSVVDKIQVPEVVLNNARGRYDFIFLLEQIPHYTQDAVRREDESKLKILARQLRQSYLQFGYSPTQLPVMPLEDRVGLILEIVNKSLERRR